MKSKNARQRAARRCPALTNRIPSADPDESSDRVAIAARAPRRPSRGRPTSGASALDMARQGSRHRSVHHARGWLGVTFVCLALACVRPAPAAELSGLPHAEPEAVGMNAARLATIDSLVDAGLRAGEMAGAVVLVARDGRVVYLRAFGHRQELPAKVPMTTDTVFDLASLTKPIATATSVMKLLASGQIHLDEPVAKYIPEFGQNGKSAVTIRQLLTHQGGLTPDNALRDYQDGTDKAWQRIWALPLIAPAGGRFIYTDVGYMVLGELVHRVSGVPLAAFCQQNIFAPLGMTETGFLPSESLRQRSAATEQREGRWMCGEVHDPRAYLLGGVAGHAGLFSTAEDLAIYGQMVIQNGQYAGTQILPADVVAQMTTPHRVSSGMRGLGWDMRTGYSSNRGDRLSPRAVGHGGFTGTGIWIDPELRLTVVFLSNRLHPDGKGSVNPLIGRIVNTAADAIDAAPAVTEQPSNKAEADLPADLPTDSPAHSPVRAPDAASPAASPQTDRGADGAAIEHGQTLTGIDVLVRGGFHELRGRRVGLITNQTGVDGTGVSTVDRLLKADGVELRALFSPEHGLEGKLDVQVADANDARTGLPVYSLYGANREPTAASLEGLDTLVFDIQDIGARFYTYISTMGNALRVAARHRLRFVVLDRPNPINGTDVAGPVLDPGSESFVGFHTLPVRHGMTVGELAAMFNDELRLGADLQVVPLESWRRQDYFDRTGLLWINPSPNMRSLAQAVLYPGIGLLETTNVSVGRGTDTPFEVIGAPWLDGIELARTLNASDLAGVRFIPIRFTPTASKFAGQACGGVNISVVDRASFRPVRTGLEIARQLRQLYPDDWEAKRFNGLLSHRRTLEAVLAGESVDAMESAWTPDLSAFLERRSRFLRY